MTSRLAEAAATLLGGDLVQASRLPGGDLSDIVRIRLADGREAVAKGGPQPRVEAVMLEAIAAGGARAPAVLAVSDSLLVIEALPENDRVSNAWEDLGAMLATLHRTVGTRYGWPADYAFGHVRIENTFEQNWPAFWAERRLLVHLPAIPTSIGQRIETLAASLADRLPSRPTPALLHGDLWGGNVLVADGRVSGLIDPACYYGHNEVDVAMLALFDRPSPAFFARYGAPDAGHAERLPIYQLWPALVHLRLFGSGYESWVERLLAATGA